MDLIEGSDLARELSAGPVSVVRALRWVSEAADAIEHAHQQGVVHCDLKPSNLLLDRAGHLHVTDFGLGRSLSGDRLSVGGTVGFMAPEQIDPTRGPISPRTDVYGLGAVLYTLLAGQPPFRSDSPSEPWALDTLRRDIPASVTALCHHCLVREPERRLASAAELAATLRILEESLGSP
jgi:serine/threonine-protein kinase